jgi:hypothetical protein
VNPLAIATDGLLNSNSTIGLATRGLLVIVVKKYGNVGGEGCFIPQNSVEYILKDDEEVLYIIMNIIINL